MNYRESLSVGLEGLRAHLLRSILTMLGIIFGVSAVIAMLSIGEGAKQEALEQIQLMGMNNIIIQDKPLEDQEQGEGKGNLFRRLTYADALSIQELNPLVDVVVPQKEISQKVQYKNESREATVIGTTPDYEEALNYYCHSGSFFNYRDVNEVRRVCTLGSGIKRELFHFRDPIGEKVKIENQWYTVIGIMEHKAITAGGKNQGLHIRNLNRDVYIPISSALRRFPLKPFESPLTRITVKIKDADRILEAAKFIKKTMDRRHNGTDDYEIIIPEALLQQRQRTQRIFNIVMGAIAGISLLVGGIGIMNIMLATVLERTREIGIRRAVGATRKDILGQFLMEALVLSFSGGFVGILLGYAMTKIITHYADWRTIVSIGSIFLAFGVSASVGIIFGLYPARKAALLEPIESLRYE